MFYMQRWPKQVGIINKKNKANENGGRDKKREMI